MGVALLGAGAKALVTPALGDPTRRDRVGTAQVSIGWGHSRCLGVGGQGSWALQVE